MRANSIGTVSSVDLGSSLVAIGILRLPVPEVTAHSLQVVRSLEA